MEAVLDTGNELDSIHTSLASTLQNIERLIRRNVSALDRTDHVQKRESCGLFAACIFEQISFQGCIPLNATEPSVLSQSSFEAMRPTGKEERDVAQASPG